MFPKKKNNKILYISVFIVLFILITISLLYQGNDKEDKNVLKNISMFIDKIVMYPFTELTQGKKEKPEESYLIQKNVNSSLEKEIQELKDQLELNKTLTEYDPVHCTVLSRNRSYWFNTITIDKGTKSGIKKNMAVITKNGLVGKISKVSKNSAEVKLITSNDVNYKVSVAIKTNDVDHFAIMNGYDLEKGLMKASGIDKTSPVNIGDTVLTSGLGELFPSGIYVGTVEDIQMDKYNLSKIVSIKTGQDFHSIHYVTVLKVKA